MLATAYTILQFRKYFYRRQISFSNMHLCVWVSFPFSFRANVFVSIINISVLNRREQINITFVMHFISAIAKWKLLTSVLCCSSQKQHIWSTVFSIFISVSVRDLLEQEYGGHIWYYKWKWILLFYDKFVACDSLIAIKIKLLEELAIYLVDFMSGE